MVNGTKSVNRCTHCLNYWTIICILGWQVKYGIVTYNEFQVKRSFSRVFNHFFGVPVSSSLVFLENNEKIFPLYSWRVAHVSVIGVFCIKYSNVHVVSRNISSRFSSNSEEMFIEKWLDGYIHDNYTSELRNKRTMDTQRRSSFHRLLLYVFFWKNTSRVCSGTDHLVLKRNWSSPNSCRYNVNEDS